jgi:DUF2905 family protein
MRDLGRLLILAGVVLVAIGVAVSVLPRLGIGRLPGDFVFRKGNFTFYVPLMTSILLSIALTLIFWLFRR